MTFLSDADARILRLWKAGHDTDHIAKIMRLAEHDVYSRLVRLQLAVRGREA